MPNQKAVHPGARFGRLTILNPVPDAAQNTTQQLWQCKCDCGKECIRTAQELTKRKMPSCGCAERERLEQSLKRARAANPIMDGTNLASISSTKVYKNNTSGVRGVRWSKQKRKWIAVITLQGKRIFLGYYTDKEKAIAARKKAEQNYFEPVLDKHRKELKHENG